MNGRGEGQVEELREQVAAVLAERTRLAEKEDIAAQLRDRLAYRDDEKANARDHAAEIRDDKATLREHAAHESALRRGSSTDPHPEPKPLARPLDSRRSCRKPKPRRTRQGEHACHRPSSGQTHASPAHGIIAAEALLQLFIRASNDRTELREAAHRISTDLATASDY